MTFKDFLTKERAIHTSKNATVSLVSHLGVIALTLGFLWSLFEHMALLLWAMLAAATAFIGWLWNHDHERQFNRRLHRVAKHGRTIESAAIGFMWGLVPILFFTDQSTTYLIFLVTIYTGYVSGAATSSFANAASFWGFTTLISVPFAWRMFEQGDELHTMIGGLVLFYVCMLSFVARNMQVLFIESTQKKFENLKLVEDLAAEKDAVERAVIAKDRFLASASHDLRQPLNAITLFVDALTPLQNQQLAHEIIRKIRFSLNGLNGMLHSLLDIAKLDAEVVDVKPSHVALHSIIEQLTEEYQETKANDVHIHNYVAIDAVIFADPTIIYRISRNLIDNAVKYTPKGAISISTATEKNTIVLVIKDTGIGIPADKIDIVFNEFEQLNNSERHRDKGLGLGLSIVQRLCRVSNIDLNIESELNSGTTVTLRLKQGNTIDTTNHRQHNKVDLSGQLAVVIDDDDTTLEAVAYVLEHWQCQIVTASTLEQALTTLSQQCNVPDLIISDFRLANHEQGTRAIDVIREEYNTDIPAVLMTGDTAPERLRQAKEHDLVLIHKPFDNQALLRAIEKAMA